jgi:hypothetical protein
MRRWLQFHHWLRFDLATLLCFVLALNFMIFANWQARFGYFDEHPGTKPHSILWRPAYDVGWPWPFLRISGMKDRIVTHTALDNEPLVTLSSPVNAVASITVNLVTALLITWAFVWLRIQIMRPRAIRRRDQSIKPAAPTS